MIPARLKLENFMCFSKIEVDFSNLKTACLTGKNGSGKSSILDAITWALWEMARSNSDKLIKLGMSNMKVELEFFVEDVRYKVIRFYRKGALNNPRKATKSTLELFYYDSAKNTWQPYSGKSINETQSRINNIIKLEYDAFVNSIYIRQGQAESFLTRTPEERKAVLADILGLGEYEKLYRRSMDKVEKLKIEAKVLKEQINDAEIKQFSLKKFRNSKEELIVQINSIQEKLSSMMKEKKDLEVKQNQFKVLKEQQILYSSLKDKYEDDYNRTKKQIENLKVSIDKFKKTIAIEEVIKHQYEHYLEQKENLKVFDNKELEYHKLKDRLIEFGSKQMIKRYGAEQEYTKICESLDQKLAELDRCRKIIDQSEDIQKKYLEYKDLKNKIDNLSEFKIELADIDVKIAKLQNVINKFALEYKSKIEHLENSIEEIGLKLESKPELLEQISLLENEIKQYDKYDAELERVREKGVAEREVIFDRGNKNAFLEMELDKLKEKINLLQKQNKDTECPTCSGKVLNINDITSKLEFEIDNLMIQIESNENDISIAEDEMKFLRVSYKEKKKYLSKRQGLIFDLAELKTALKNLELEEQKLDKLNQELIEARDILKNEAFAEEERHQISILTERRNQIDDLLANFNNLLIKCRDLSYIEEAYDLLNKAKETAQSIENELPYFTMSKRTLEKELQAPVKDGQSNFAQDAYAKLVELNYDLEQHIALRQQINNSEEIEYDYLSLQFAHQQLPFLENNLAQLEIAEKNYKEEVNRVIENNENIQAKIIEYSDFNQQIETLTQEYTTLTQELNDCNCELAVINDRIKSVEEIISSTKDKKIQLESLNNDISHYIELANAFGEKGMQDMIIQNSIPEIENEANRLLSRLTDTNMRVMLKSSKNNKTGDINDRIDIYIADNQGTRSYELYSGGEAFRINFAIRLALSKWLANSRGVKLQTLIIDDAFGLLDQTGIEKFSSIIKLIEYDFDFILIVTHVDEIVDLFPSRIEISKVAGSSSVEVVA